MLAAMAIRFVYFDWGDTLAANYGMPYRHVQRRALDRLGTDLAAAGGTVDAAWVDGFWQELHGAWRDSVDHERNPDHREIDFAGILNRWVERAGAGDAEQVTEAVMRFGDTCTDIVIPYAGIEAPLAALKDAGFGVGILSHVPWPGPDCRRWFERWGLAPYIDHYSLSSDIGWIKPNPAHYQDALDQAGCAADEILMVGDHPKRDIIGAREFGFRTCHKIVETVYPDDLIAACKPDATIIHIREVPGVVERLNRA